MCVNGSCGKKPVGVACATGADCDSAVCAQGICCASDCGSTCKSCALLGSAGSCVNVPAGQDPLKQCDDVGAPTCGSDGTCDGQGSCRLYPAGTSCAPMMCNGSTLTGAQVCDGAGTCRAASETTCDPFACGASACRNACATSAD